MIEVPASTCVLFSDVGCPWSHVAVHRWRAERQNRGLQDEISLELRSFPLELFNRKATPKHILDVEIPVAGALAPGAGWKMWQKRPHDYAVTMLPALEAIHAAREQNVRASEDLDVALRRAFFGESRNVSLHHIILEIAQNCEGVEVGLIEAALESGVHRERIFADLDLARAADVKGSPQFFLPDGSNYHNPGIEMHWEGKPGEGFPVVDKDDPNIYAEMFDRIARSS